MFTIGRLAKQFGLSRSTLLYYDSIGLLTASVRSESEYRLYSEEDKVRLERICRYRQTGLSLEEIKSLLHSKEAKAEELLEGRLQKLNLEIGKLREQQALVIKILRKSNLINKSRIMTKEIWVSILRSAGIDEKGMKSWHEEFECQSPQGHQDFLESLSLSKKEIARIRQGSRQRRSGAEGIDEVR